MLLIPRGSDTKQRSEVSEEFPGRVVLSDLLPIDGIRSR